MSKNHMRSSGFTLVELIAGLSLSTIIVFISLFQLQLTIRAHRKNTERASAHMQLTLGMEKIKSVISSGEDMDRFMIEDDCMVYIEQDGTKTTVFGPLDGLIFLVDNGYDNVILKVTLQCAAFSLTRDFFVK